MKKPLVILALLFLIGITAAYEISIDAPATIQRGEPLVITGTSNLPAGTTVDLQLSRSEYTLEVMDTRQVVIQGDKNFTVTFDTKNLTRGQHKVEVLQVMGFSFLGGSVTLRVIQVIDRSNELEITSPAIQYSDTMLSIAGRLPSAANRGVQLLVSGPIGVIFGPEYISTTGTGVFAKQVPIRQEGTYEVSFTDAKGYVGNATFTVMKSSAAVTTIPTMTATAVATPSLGTVSASATASRENPAYFSISTRPGSVRFFTSISANADWVIEYLDEKGVRQPKVNQRGRSIPEEVAIQAQGGVISVMVYPNTYSDKDMVTLYADNADWVRVIDSPPAALAAPPTTVPTTKKSPPSAIMPVLGAGIALAFLMKRRN